MDDGDEADTPRPERVGSSHEARALADLGLALASIAVRIGEAAGNCDKLEGDKRKSLFLDIAHEIADHGDNCHVIRRLIEEIYR